jgi:hypothetical protein
MIVPKPNVFLTCSSCLAFAWRTIKIVAKAIDLLGTDLRIVLQAHRRRSDCKIKARATFMNSTLRVLATRHTDFDNDC